ncbi:hypothetical protein PLEOSDRAFT_1086298 [Pleurotus ostreatus PC15]|uniref:CBF1-interacting co-repressor CIR N-terminal domain-containing protein n=1 Tax=Pleurotus ostreatus (strain PC15) TaxID=1137138 RepID=A0A067NAF3_PLEO1|nr:hypothetical protein PLEOSDRAFT_1086298 [Pleurotus ostreatus PC15]
MGKLNIAHHKSYHPYRRDNIERVRKDEEEAARKEAQEEGRMMLADSEARIDLLRERAGTQRDSSGRRSRKRDDFDEEKVATTSAPQPALTNPNGHINLFEDLEQSQMSAAIRSSSKKKSDPVETDKGVPLAPCAKDLNPWYSSRNDDSKPVDEAEEGRRPPSRLCTHLNTNQRSGLVLGNPNAAASPSEIPTRYCTRYIVVAETKERESPTYL